VAPMSCRRSSRFWGLGCPKIFHEIEDSLAYKPKDKAKAEVAIRQVLSVHYLRLPTLFEQLRIAHGDGSWARLMNRLLKMDLLILDDWGLPLAPSAHRVSRVASRLPGNYPPSLRSPWRAASAYRQGRTYFCFCNSTSSLSMDSILAMCCSMVAMCFFIIACFRFIISGFIMPMPPTCIMPHFI